MRRRTTNKPWTAPTSNFLIIISNMLIYASNMLNYISNMLIYVSEVKSESGKCWCPRLTASLSTSTCSRRELWLLRGIPRLLSTQSLRPFLTFRYSVFVRVKKFHFMYLHSTSQKRFLSMHNYETYTHYLLSKTFTRLILSPQLLKTVTSNSVLHLNNLNSALQSWWTLNLNFDLFSYLVFRY